MSRQWLVIRADASTEMGTGHIMRCLALAQAWKDTGGHVTLVTACDNQKLLQRFRAESFEVVSLPSHTGTLDWKITRDALTRHAGAWLVLDGYHFDEAYQHRAREGGNRCLVIDDLAHLRHYYADFVLNQNLYAEQLGYSCEPYARLLLGTRYALLRREFLRRDNSRREFPMVARKVLVTIGGSDPNNVTLRVLEALRNVRTDGLCVHVVVGDANPHLATIQAEAGQSPHSVALVQDATDMSALMAWADFAVSAAGSVCWELAYMGLPSLLLPTADNQKATATALENAGAASIDSSLLSRTCTMSLLIQSLLEDPAKRKAMSQAISKFVDGGGAARTAAMLIHGIL